MSEGTVSSIDDVLLKGMRFTGSLLIAVTVVRLGAEVKSHKFGRSINLSVCDHVGER